MSPYVYRLRASTSDGACVSRTCMYHIKFRMTVKTLHSYSLSRHRHSRALVASGYDICRPMTCGASRRLNNMYRVWKVFPVVHTYILTTELALYCICIQTSSAKSSLTLGTHYSCSRAVFMGHGPCTRASFLDTRLSRSAAAIVNDVIIIFYLQDGCPK